MSFEEQAAAWIEWARWPLDAYWFYREQFFELLPPPCRTLEVGCGEGRVSRDLRGRGYDVVGLDSSETLLAAARETDPAGEYVLGQAETLPFDAASAGYARRARGAAPGSVAASVAVDAELRHVPRRETLIRRPVDAGYDVRGGCDRFAASHPATLMPIQIGVSRT